MMRYLNEKHKKEKYNIKKKASSKHTPPDVIDRAPLFIIEMSEMETTQSLQYVSPDVALELPDPICDHT